MPVTAAGLLHSVLVFTCNRRKDCCCDQAANNSADDRADAGRTAAPAAAGCAAPRRLGAVVCGQGHAQATNLRSNASLAQPTFRLASINCKW